MRFVTFGERLSLDTMQRVGDTPNGLNEALVSRALEVARSRGVPEVSLNYAGLAHLVRGEPSRNRVVRGLTRMALGPLHRRFQMDRLVRFNEKFSPQWRPRYLVYESRAALPRAVVRVLQAEGYLPHHGRSRLGDAAARGRAPRTARPVATARPDRTDAMRLPRPRPLVAIVTAALAVVGLIGTFNYWESYYQHRGFATVAFLPRAHPGHLQTVHFYSPALHRVADYIVYTPPGYDTGREPYPVYYLLHGSPGRPVVYLDIAQMPVRMDNLISQHRMRPMILVFPDGRIGGSTYSDSEWANTPSGAFASYVIDVVHNVDDRFRTLARRQDRVIAGFSAGAYGATNIALKHITTFANLQAWSGYYIETRSGAFANASAAMLRANSPLDYVGRLRATIARNPVRAFCSWAATTTTARRPSRWPLRWPRPAAASPTRCTAAATTGSCGTPTSIRC